MLLRAGQGGCEVLPSIIDKAYPKCSCELTELGLHQNSVNGNTLAIADMARFEGNAMSHNAKRVLTDGQSRKLFIEPLVAENQALSWHYKHHALSDLVLDFELVA